MVFGQLQFVLYEILWVLRRVGKLETKQKLMVKSQMGMSLSSRRKTDVNMFDGMGAGGGDESSEHTLGYGNSA